MLQDSLHYIQKVLKLKRFRATAIYVNMEAQREFILCYIVCAWFSQLLIIT